MGKIFFDKESFVIRDKKSGLLLLPFNKKQIVEMAKKAGALPDNYAKMLVEANRHVEVSYYLIDNRKIVCAINSDYVPMKNARYFPTWEALQTYLKRKGDDNQEPQ